MSKTHTKEAPKQRKGFNVMEPAKRKRIAMLGGLALSRKVGHAGMARLGRKGGTQTWANRKAL
jgi:hypothetical protein